MITIKENYAVTSILDHHHGGVYFRTENVHISRYADTDSYWIADLTNALLPGKSCRRFSVQTNSQSLVITNWIETIFGDDIRGLMAYCEKLAYPRGKYGGTLPVGIEYDGDVITIDRYENPAPRTFSPFALRRLKPLTTVPKKWTMAHVYRALANNQVRNLKCNGYYTDDYAGDAADNYRQGVRNPLDFLRDLITQPGGWRCYAASATSVHVCCHGFDNNEFEPVI